MQLLQAYFFTLVRMNNAAEGGENKVYKIQLEGTPSSRHHFVYEASKKRGIMPWPKASNIHKNFV